MITRISVPRILAVLVLWGFGMVSLNYEVSKRTPQLRASVYHATYRSASGDLVTAPLTPHVKVIAETEVFYMLPSTETVQGILLYFHGCSHSGQDLFQLPEDRIVALAALNRGLALLSISSANRLSGCWSSKDIEILERDKIVDKWMESVGLSPDLPRMGLGASSGASFLFASYKVLHLKSMASYLSPEFFESSDLDQALATPIPPTIFVHMPRDKATATAIQANRDVLDGLNIPTDVLDVLPHPLTPELCAKRLPEFGDRRCHSFLRDVMSRNPNLLGNDNSIQISYQSGEWNDIMMQAKLDKSVKHSSSLTSNAAAVEGLEEKKVGTLSTKSFSGHSWLWASVEEEIAVSFALHEMTAEKRGAVLDFLMKHAGISTLDGQT